MGKHILTLIAVLLTLGLLAAGCEDTEEGTDGGMGGDGAIPGDGQVQPDLGPAPEGVVTHKSAGESAEASFETGDEQFLVVPYSVSETETDAIDFEIKLVEGAGATDGGVGTQSYTLRQAQRLPLSVRNPALWQYWQKRLVVERWTRQQAEKAAGMRLVAPGAKMDKTIQACTLSSECGETEVCNGGTCTGTVTLRVAEFANSDTTDVEVKAKNDTVAILVDTADTVDAAAIDAMAETFEKVIYPRDVGLFSNPPLTEGEATLSTDRNADGLVWLVFTSKVSDKMEAVGFFNAMDFTEETNSNKADILYIDSGQQVEETYATMAHEFQHLLNFAVKKYKPEANGESGALEALWLDEGQAHFAEGACGWPGGNVVLLDQEVFTAFSETAMISSTDSVQMRGMAYLFVRYLFEQKGGVTYNADGSITDSGGGAFLTQLHTTASQSVDAIGAAFGDFKGAFGDWIAAVALDGRGVTDFATYIYQPLMDDPVNNVKLGVKIRGQRTDDQGGTVELQGPMEEDLTADVSDAIPNTTAKFFLLKGKSGVVDVTVTSDASDFRFALIKVSQ
jgi:hypothetical protein